MRIEHVAIWVNDLEKIKNFYLTYFDCTSGARYENPVKGFSSYFIRFDGGARIELMNSKDMESQHREVLSGWTHIAVEVGNASDVDVLTARMEQDGYVVAGYPRVTGDGYYESVVLDPEGNRIELVAYPESQSDINNTIE